MKTLLLTMDLEEFVTPAEIGMKVNKDEMFKISIEGLKNFKKILDKYEKLKVTFFTTWEFAEKAEKELKEILENGRHELALHGLEHSLDYPKMNEKKLQKVLSKAKKKLENKFNTKIKGFRAPQMGSIKLSVLKKIRIKYDSSLHPTYIPGKYNNFFKSRNIYLENGIYEIPVSVTPLFRLPFSWIWLRNMGFTYAKFCSNLNFINSDYVNIYLHPWEFVNINIDPYNKKILKLIIRKTGDKYLKLVDNLIKWYFNKNLKSMTINEYLEKKYGNK